MTARMRPYSIAICYVLAAMGATFFLAAWVDVQFILMPAIFLNVYGVLGTVKNLHGPLTPRVTDDEIVFGAGRIFYPNYAV